MSKGHMEALAALKAGRQPILSRPAHKAAQKELNRQMAAAAETVTLQKTVTASAKGGRGKKVHASAADKQKAYRARKKAKA